MATPNPIYPADLRQLEIEQIQQRRRRADDTPTPINTDGDHLAANGIGFSGGGIRSATFALGVSQAIAKAKLWAQFDFMSTVSGGGYFGAFLGRLFQLQGTVNKAEYALQDGAGVTHLRLFSRYLAPGGNDDGWAAAAIMLRNLFFLQALFFFFAVSTATVAVLVSHIGREWTVVQQFNTHLPAVFFPALFFLLALLLVSLFYFALAINGVHFRRGDGEPLWLNVLYALLRGLLSLALLVLLFAPLAAVGEQTKLVVAHYSTSLLHAFPYALVVFIVIASFIYLRPQDEHVVSAWRMRTTRLLRLCLLVFCIALACALIDWIAFNGLRYLQKLDDASLQGLLGKAFGALLGSNLLITIGQRIAQTLSSSKDMSGRLQGYVLTAILVAVAVVILSSFIIVAFICAHAAGFDVTGDYSPFYWRLLALCALAFIAVGSISAFANYTSIHSFYFSRLKRAWLRAATLDSNGNGCNDMYSTRSSDDVPISDYQPQQAGGPIHLINCTINETLGKDTGLYQADRKGLQLAISSHVISVGARHHLLSPWQKPTAFSRFQLFGDNTQLGPDQLTLGRWVAISGAAFSTGLGQATRWYYALLAASLNVRLGFWWRTRRNKNVDALKPRLPWALLQESFGMFRGTCDAHWYLTDGGHFENMAGYELIRRRLSRLVIVDAECDSDYQFGGMAILVHKARLDFNADIYFLSDEEIARICGRDICTALGSLKALSENGRCGGHSVRAALAQVCYDGCDPKLDAGFDDPTVHWLLYIKPVIAGTETLDVTQYKAENPDFPQQTTIDQFFDERQWEAYRQLGEITGDSLSELLKVFLLK